MATHSPPNSSAPKTGRNAARYLFWALSFDFDFADDKLYANVKSTTDWKWRGIYPNGNRGPEGVVKFSGRVGTYGKLPIDSANRISGSWPIDLGPFGGSNGWNIFKFDGSSGYSFPQAPPKAPLW
jgi:hypothetical protein